MITCSQLYKKKVYIIGLGRTGLGAVASLLASDAFVYAWDDKEANIDSYISKYPGLVFRSPQEMDWSTMDFVLLSPGIPSLPGKEHHAVKLARSYNVPIISDIDVLYLACPKAKYIGITGTNGKSTTTALIGHILNVCKIKNQVGGNIGISVLELDPLEDGVYVLETSSFQLDLLNYAKFNIALLLNITPDHLDRHGTMDNYIDAKLKIFRNQAEVDKAIISKDYQITQDIIEKVNNVITISNVDKAEVYMQDRVLFDNLNNLKFDFNDYKFLPGKHNEENIAASYAAATSLGLDAKQVVDAIKQFKGLSHRIELVLEKDNIKFINDSKATNAEAAEKALNCFDNIFWIIGGVPKEGGIKSLAPLLPKIQHTFLIGQSQDEFAEFLKSKGSSFTKSGTLENALEEIKRLHLRKGVVLFSPACASFDQFKDYEHRGNEFKRLVLKHFEE